jgi:hypothetical protein
LIYLGVVSGVGHQAGGAGPSRADGGDSSLSLKFKVSLLVMSCLWHVDMEEVEEETVGIIMGMSGG